MNKYEAEIERSRQLLANHLAHMDGLVDAILTEVSNYLVTWTPEQVANSIKGDPKLSKELGVEGLRPVKLALDDYVVQIPALVEQYCDNDEYWVHQSKGRPQQGAESRYRPAAGGWGVILDNPVRQVLEPVSDFMTWAGFVTRVPGAETNCYQIPSIKWPIAVTEAVQAYGNAVVELGQMYDKAAAAQRDLAEDEAAQLWAQVNSDTQQASE